MRVGHGYDVHRFKEGRNLVLGGVEIEYKLGLDGHSDADVLLHAVADSLLGAAGLGDIGRLYPDNDPKFEGIDSRVLLRDTVSRIKEKGYKVVNIDCTVIAQAPKLSPYVETMAENIAADVGVDPDFVNVKATTEEHLGFTGKMEGISAHAVSLIDKI
jgi:2-C-methyl-D-erythritol 2,4-cyclodiphosphate synthase